MTRTWKSVLRYALLILCALVSLGVDDCCNGSDHPIVAPGGGGDDGNLLLLSVYRCGTDFNGFSFVGADTVTMVVGDGGIALVRFSRSSRYMPLGPLHAGNLNGVWSGRIVADGDPPGAPGLIFSFDIHSLAWRLNEHPATGNCTDIDWPLIATSNGEVLHQETLEADWTVIFKTTRPARFTGVSSKDVRAVAVGPGGMIWQADNFLHNWKDASVPNGPDFNDVFMYRDATATLNSFAVGGTEIWSRHGEDAWQLEFGNLPGELRAVTTRGHYEAYAVGTNGLIMTHDGNSWSQQTVRNTAHFRDVYISEMDHGIEVFAVGDDGAIFERTGGVWRDLEYSNISPWNDFDGFSSDEIYAANGDTLMQWDGSAWGPMAVAGNEITSLQVIAPKDIWVITRGPYGLDHFVNHWDGATFQISHHSSMDPFNSIWCNPAGDTVLVAANNGYVFRKSGPSWEWLTADASRRHFYDLDGTSAHDIYAVGQGGLIVHFDGSTWTEMATGVKDTLRAIDGPVAVGDNGVVLRRNGSSWKAENTGTTASLNAVCYLGDNDVWAVGDGGQVIHYDGSEWKVYLRTLYTVDLTAVWGATSKDIWFGGEDGYLLKLEP